MTRPSPSRGVIDTSTVIMLSRIEDPASLPAEPLITAVTLAELSVGPLVATTDEERAARQAHVQQAEADFDPLPFDAPAARALGRVAASLRRAGRKPSARAYDAMIAATALSNDLPVHIDPIDLSGIDGLTVIAVPAPAAPNVVDHSRQEYMARAQPRLDRPTIGPGTGNVSPGSGQTSPEHPEDMANSRRYLDSAQEGSWHERARQESMGQSQYGRGERRLWSRPDWRLGVLHSAGGRVLVRHRGNSQSLGVARLRHI